MVDSFQSFSLTKTADAESGRAGSGCRSSKVRAIRRGVAGPIVTAARDAGVVLEAHDGEQGEDYWEKRSLFLYQSVLNISRKDIIDPLHLFSSSVLLLTSRTGEAVGKGAGATAVGAGGGGGTTPKKSCPEGLGTTFFLRTFIFLRTSSFLAGGGTAALAAGLSGLATGSLDEARGCLRWGGRGTSTFFFLNLRTSLTPGLSPFCGRGGRDPRLASRSEADEDAAANAHATDKRSTNDHQRLMMLRRGIFSESFNLLCGATYSLQVQTVTNYVSGIVDIG